MPQKIIGSDLLHPGFRSGRYYSIHDTAVGSTSSSNAGTALNTLSYTPFVITKPVSIDRVCIQCSGVLLSVARFGIYSNSNGLPSNLIVDAGEATCTTAGLKENVISVNLPPAWYWMAINSNIALPSLVLEGYSSNGLSPYIGQSTGGNTITSGLRQASVAYGALPSIAPISNLSDTGSTPFYWLRVA